MENRKLAVYIDASYISFATEDEMYKYKVSDNIPAIFKSMDQRFKGYTIIIQNRAQLDLILEYYNIYMRNMIRLSDIEKEYLSFNFIKEFTLYDRIELLNIHPDVENIHELNEAECLYILVEAITGSEYYIPKSVRCAIIDVFNFKTYVKIREDIIYELDYKLEMGCTPSDFYNIMRQRALTLPREMYNQVINDRVNETINIHDTIKYN